jgi:hypothetical protein
MRDSEDLNHLTVGVPKFDPPLDYVTFWEGLKFAGHPLLRSFGGSPVVGKHRSQSTSQNGWFGTENGQWFCVSMGTRVLSHTQVSRCGIIMYYIYRIIVSSVYSIHAVWFVNIFMIMNIIYSTYHCYYYQSLSIIIIIILTYAYLSLSIWHSFPLLWLVTTGSFRSTNGKAIDGSEPPVDAKPILDSTSPGNTLAGGDTEQERRMIRKTGRVGAPCLMCPIVRSLWLDNSNKYRTYGR